MKVRMLRDHDHRISPAVVQAFKAETEVDVPKATAEALIGAGAAEAIKSPPRAAAPADQE